MLKRKAFYDLSVWAKAKHRKPLLLRGARQVGKTHLARQAGQALFQNTVEINLEQSPEIAKLFEGDLNPKRIVEAIELITEQKIVAGETLLFLDEIQVAPRAILALRYFYELMPALHVMAAGSLLEFAIEEVGMPVGRVSFLWIRPLSFIEFLLALNATQAVEEILHHSADEPINEVVHEKLLRYVGEYMCIGGMPESVAAWQANRDIQQCQEILDDIVTSYTQDFVKYSKSLQIKYVELLFQRIPLQLTKPFVYNHVSDAYRKRELAPCVQLLIKAGIISPVYRSAANGIPLGAEADLEKFKLIFVDVALTQHILGLSLKEWLLEPLKTFVNKGALVEAFIGQEILAYHTPRKPTTLYYWKRNARSSQAEVDYVIAKEVDVVPVEVKSGMGSTLHSLHAYLDSYKANYGIRFSGQNYSVFEKVHSYPLYAVAKALDYEMP
jgi:predicted AAA+ superfamily ATPase